jgi:tetratricopeptide (TPR) repeat protein
VVSRLTIFLLASLFASVGWSQDATRVGKDPSASTVIGPRNVPLHLGAQALLAGDSEEGVELTLRGLRQAHGRREEEAALSNLCAGYIKLGNFTEALKYCDILLTRNDKNWRGYNNRAVVHIMTKQYEKAASDLDKGEELNPGARTLKVARAMYMDAVYPVRPEIEIDDREKSNDDDSES